MSNPEKPEVPQAPIQEAPPNPGASPVDVERNILASIVGKYLTQPKEVPETDQLDDGVEFLDDSEEAA